MSKKKIIRKSNKSLNLFAEGGETNSILSKNNIGNAISGIGSIINSGIQNYQTGDTSSLENNIKQAGNYTVQASNNDDLMNEWGTFSPMENVSWKDLRGGNTNQRIGNTIGAIGSGIMTGSSVGGPIGAIAGGIIGLGSAIGGWLTGNKKAKNKANKFNKQIEAVNERNLIALKDKAQSLDSQNDLNIFANYSAYGGPINIFGSGAIDYELAKENLYNKHLNTMNKYKMPFSNLMNTYNSNIFDEGGSISNDSNFSNGVTLINNGGTHEENPMEGVPMGISPEGIPNLVEQGEVRFNNYIFSNRLFATPKLLEEHNLPLSYANHSFADIAEKLNKESSERPNDPISKRGLISSMAKLQNAQEQLRMEKNKKGDMYAYGGKVGKKFNYGGIDDGYNVLLPYSPSWMDSFAGKKDLLNIPKTFDATTYNNDKKMEILNNLSLPTKNNSKTIPVEFDPSIKINFSKFNDPINTYDINNNITTKNGDKESRFKINSIDPTWLRYAPTLGAGIGVVTDVLGLTNKPDYKNADLIVDTLNNQPTIEFNPIGNYLTYKPFDRDYYINKLNAQSGATRRAIINQSGGNRATAMANILAADYNALGRMGDLARQAEEYNMAQRERVEGFNRDTNKFNSEGSLRADIANRERDRLMVQAKIAQAKMREDADARASMGRAANLTNLFNSLGDIGREAFSRNMILSNPALYYSIDSNGKITYKNGYEDLSEAEKEIIKEEAKNAKENQRAYGGYLTIRKNRNKKNIRK